MKKKLRVNYFNLLSKNDKKLVMKVKGLYKLINNSIITSDQLSTIIALIKLTIRDQIDWKKGDTSF